MEDIEVTGIVLSSMPYKEKDKLIHIFTIELGNITGILKGVASPKAKLKFAGQPFCFGKFDLTSGHDFYVVKGVESIDTFFDITLDYENFRLCNLMLEVCKLILKPNIISEKLFIDLLKSLQNVVYNNVDTRLCVLKFLCNVLEIIGYKLNFDNCDNCNMKFMGDIKFDFDTGTLRCANCSGGHLISRQEFASLKIICECEIEKIVSVKLKPELVTKLLKMIIYNLSQKINCKFKSIDIKEL